MFTTIVAGTDGSPCAEAAIRVVARLAHAHPGLEVHLVAAYDPWAAAQLRSIAAEVPADLREQLQLDAVTSARLERAAAMFDAVDVSLRAHSVVDDPTEALLRTAEDHGADLIVVGSRGEGSIGRAVHGSVATKIAQHALCSVMVVRAG